jgi:hypothetical protein
MAANDDHPRPLVSASAKSVDPSVVAAIRAAAASSSGQIKAAYVIMPEVDGARSAVLAVVEIDRSADRHLILQVIQHCLPPTGIDCDFRTAFSDNELLERARICGMTIFPLH